jgi:hypothetical protein
MAGVAGPMLASDRRAALRFLAGLLVGETAAGVLLAIPAYLFSEAARALIPLAGRLWALAAVCAVFAMADLANRTPRLPRQVPQALIYRLPPGTLGVAWGFDLGLLFTTRKTVSLIWVAIAAGVLLDPALAAGIATGAAMLAGLAIVAGSMSYRPGVRSRPGATLRIARQASGAVILASSFLTAAQAWHA